MAKISGETTETINSLKQQSLEIVDRATAAEFNLFKLFGETTATISYLEEMKNVAEEAASTFSQLSNLQLNIAQAQPAGSFDLLKLLYQVIERTIIRMPALEHSVQEVEREWSLP